MSLLFFVCNAGGGVFGSIYDEKLLDKLNSMINLNLYSVVTLTQLAVPHLEKSKGAIVNISSIVGQRAVIIIFLIKSYFIIILKIFIRINIS